MTARTILIVGQTPPPLGGQAIMIEKLLQGDYGDIKLVHVRMEYSKGMDQVGKFQLNKLVELLKVIFKIIYARFAHHIQVLYYPPSGPDMIPFFRDILTLVPTRWLFKRTIFHFHASGLMYLYDRLSPFMKSLFRIVYYNPDASIRTSEFTPEDAKAIRSKREYIIPYGIEDCYLEYQDLRCRESHTPVNILFIGVLRPSKGIDVLLQASTILLKKELPFHISIMGKFHTQEYEKEVLEYVQDHHIGATISFLGELSGDAKWKTFASSDIFCFPTYFESEAFSVVLVEALSFGLPIVSTNWRGIPSMVQDGVCGFLVPIRDALAVADKLEVLIRDPEIRRSFGDHSRQRYLDMFTIKKYHQHLHRVFQDVLSTC